MYTRQYNVVSHSPALSAVSRPTSDTTKQDPGFVAKDSVPHKPKLHREEAMEAAQAFARLAQVSVESMLAQGQDGSNQTRGLGPSAAEQIIEAAMGDSQAQRTTIDRDRLGRLFSPAPSEAEGRSQVNILV